MGFSNNEANHKCWVCKTEYYNCDACNITDKWKAICCSKECFDKYMEMISAPAEVTEAPAVVVEPEVETSDVEVVVAEVEDESVELDDTPKPEVTKSAKKKSKKVDE